MGALFFLQCLWKRDKLCPETTSSFLESRDRTFTGNFKEKRRDGESKTELKSILLQNFLFPFCLLSEIPFPGFYPVLTSAG